MAYTPSITVKGKGDAAVVPVQRLGLHRQIRRKGGEFLLYIRQRSALVRYQMLAAHGAVEQKFENVLYLQSGVGMIMPEQSFTGFCVSVRFISLSSAWI